MYYSQHGEDFLLEYLFDNKKNGFYMEIGCIEGLRFSNSYIFEQKGWNGVCIEAHEDYIELLKKNRPNANVLHLAVGEKNEDNVVFYADRRGSLSTFVKEREELYEKHYKEWFTGFTEYLVKKRTLASILKKINIRSIDFISIDIEGYEVQALQGFDFTFVKPTVFVIESDSLEHRSKLEEILIPQGYIFLCNININLFYTLDKKMIKKITNKTFNDIPLIWKGNPFDNESDIYTTGKISFKQKTKNKKIRSILSLIKNRIYKNISTSLLSDNRISDNVKPHYKQLITPAYLYLSDMEKTIKIPGMTTDESCKFLFTIAFTQCLSGSIVEIGSYLGKSTVFLAKACQLSNNGKVFAIDHFKGNPGKEDFYKVERDDLSDLEHLFTQNINYYQLDEYVDLYKTDSKDAFYRIQEKKEKIRMIFIDGCHDYDAVKRDYFLFSSILSDGGIIILDDFSPHFNGVTQFVQELIELKKIEYYYAYENTFVIKT